jgi:hypothetical protein
VSASFNYNNLGIYKNKLDISLFDFIKCKCNDDFINSQFLLDEPVDVELIKGQYSYSVYESVIPPVAIIDTTGIVIEEGRMVVSGSIINSIYD